MSRFYLPLESQSDIISGVNIAYSHSKLPYASSAILSKEKLELIDAEEILNNVTREQSKLPLLIISPNVKKSNR